MNSRYISFFLFFAIILTVNGRHYLYRSSYDWKPKWAAPVIEYSDQISESPCPETPCPSVTNTPVVTTVQTPSPSPDTVTETPVPATSFSATFSSSTIESTVLVPSTQPPPTTSQQGRDCISDGGGICTASCNIGTFTIEDTSFSCEGNGIGSVCCLEP